MNSEVEMDNRIEWIVRCVTAGEAVIAAAKANVHDSSAATLIALHKAVRELEAIEKEEPKDG